jgi:PhoPQ-activated pathogenicity-related protein
MYEAYGGWTFAFADYYAINLTTWINTPKLDFLAQTIDPLNYKENLTMPKLVCDATGDEFFMPDDDYYWWGDLEGETYRLMIQNAEHSMATGIPELVPGIIGFYNTLLHGQNRPSLDWSIAPGSGDITLEVDATVLTPKEVKLQHATTFGAERRDFRLIKGDTPADPCHFIKVSIFGEACVNPIIWWGETISPVAKAPNAAGHEIWTYKLSQPMPSSGWAGFFAEVRYAGYTEGAPDVVVTTQVSIIPQTFPFKPCGSGAECYGVLV